MKDAVAAICRATPSYDRNQRQRIVNANIKAVAHPYFVEYVPLQRLCLQILRQEKMWFNDAGEKIHGFLFDGAWLWEEYLATVLKNVNFANGRLVHARNKAGSDKNPIHLFPGNLNKRARGIRYPDFYLVEKEAPDGGNPVSHLVLDAKYKKVFKKDDEGDFNGADGVPEDGESRDSVYISRDDRHQLISYLHVLAGDGDCKNSLAAVIAPCADGGGTTGSGDVRFVLDGCLGGCGGCIGAYVFPIPEACNYQDYCKKMSDLEMSFIKAKCPSPKVAFSR